MIRELPDDARVILKGPTRPSLGWYAKRELLPKDAPRQGEHWVVSRKVLEGCEAIPHSGAQAFGTLSMNNSWQLWHCPAPSSTGRQ